jgi:hypothetical protein
MTKKPSSEDYNSPLKEIYVMYALKKVFTFPTKAKAEIFSEIVSPYGNAWCFGCHVVFTARLDFITWRKIINLFRLVFTEDRPNFYTISKKSNLKLYRHRKVEEH